MRVAQWWAGKPSSFLKRAIQSLGLPAQATMISWSVSMRMRGESVFGQISVIWLE